MAETRPAFFRPEEMLVYPFMLTVRRRFLRDRRGCGIALAVLTLAACACRAEPETVRGSDFPVDLLARAQQFRSLVRAQRYDEARAMMAEDPRRWFAPREGPGQPWRVGPSSGPWSAWDEHFRSEGEVVDWRRQERSVTAVVRETNDYFRLLERGSVTNEITYFFDDEDRVAGLLIAGVGPRPAGRTEEFLAWARENEPRELDELMPGAEIDPSGDHPPRVRALLNRWRAAVGLEPIDHRQDDR